MSQNDLLNSAFEGAASPPEAGVRPWVSKEHHGENYYCYIGNCRLALTLNETRSLCDAFDKLWRGYICTNVGASQEERESVVTALQKYRRESKVYESNSSLYDSLFRGMMALFVDGDCHINEVEAIKVATLLRPIVDKVSEGRFLRRCQKRL